MGIKHSWPPTPRILWIELTSKCPFDCVFCSRKTRRGAGEHLPFPLYERLIASLRSPRRILLNYSGESACYPHLIPAIELAARTGAFVELVSVLSALPADQLEPLARSGLGRLTVSLHAAREDAYQAIYRHGSVERLIAMLREFLDICQRISQPPAVDLAFVAMERNLEQLGPVAGLARTLGLRELTVFPVMRRDEIPEIFPAELLAAIRHTATFRDGVMAAADAIGADLRVSIANPAFQRGPTFLGEVPTPYPGPLPAGARIHTCEQNPWETAHVLANGDVVACEVHDRRVMGNLQLETLEAIWHGPQYTRFREAYHQGQVRECNECVWKQAYRPGVLRSEILARERASAQLLHGWHEARDDDAIWSSQQAAARLRPRAGSTSIHVSGLLPRGRNGDGNELIVRCNGEEAGRVRNLDGGTMPFGLDFPVRPSEECLVEFQVGDICRPRELGLSADNRDLGFALVLLKSNRARIERSARAVEGWRKWMHRIDALGRGLRRLAPRCPRSPLHEATRPGISVIIPERHNAGELAEALASVAVAAAGCAEPVEVIVVAPAADRNLYAGFGAGLPELRWVFTRRPLDFLAAVQLGLTHARHEWVYLMNNDVALDPDALAALLPWRAADVFAVGSQLFLKDRTRFREETNWNRLFAEDGLAQVHDRLPSGDRVAECAYAGGGSSLFRKSVLEPLVKGASAYAPFYWEDVEWGWRARKQGYRVLFAPGSIAHHRQRSTISRFYDPDKIEAVTERNRLLFQLRNWTRAGDQERLLESLGSLPEAAARHMTSMRVRWECARVRLWNHSAARSDDALLAL